LGAKKKKQATTQPESCAKGHTILNRSCGACRGLLKAWDGKLEASGVIDIEKREHLIERPRTIDFSNPILASARFSYYQWCSTMAERGRFDSKRDKTIWEKHAEGGSRQEIAQEIRSDKAWVVRRVLKIQHSLVNQIIGSVSIADGGVFRAI